MHYEYTNTRMVAKFVESVKKYEEELILAVGVLLISLLSFAAGYLTAKEQLKEEIRVEQLEDYARE